MKKYSIGFVIVYFGTFPNYFHFWLSSCAANPEFEWLIFTDNTEPYNFPNNIHIYHTTIQETQARFQSLYEFKISLETPYKLCDFRPAFGEIYKEELAEYDFWGHCDTDLIWGRLSDYITDEILDTYDKIFESGHCTIYRNTEKISTGYRTFGKVNGIGYREVFSNKNNMVFDENGGASKWGGINALFRNNGIKTYTRVTFDDLKIAYWNFCSYRYINEKQKACVDRKKNQYLPSVYRFDGGTLKQYLLVDGELVITDSMYVHMQKRPMRVEVGVNPKAFLIVPNSLISDQCIDKSLVKNYGRYRLLYGNYMKFRFRNLGKKILRRMKCVLSMHTY